MGPIEFGKYLLLNRIATGGMAEIYLAVYTELEGRDKFVAIKKLLPNLNEDPEFLQMFMDEARIATLLIHPNIVQIYDVGCIDSQYYIAMEYLHGKDLRQIMRKVASLSTLLPLSYTILIISDICDALHYAHFKTDNKGNPLKIIHRDVSPPNIIVTFDGVTKLVDFGIAKAEVKIHHTRAGVLKGKYAYMSPEQASGEELDYRSDIFPIGTILYELTTGKRLFKLDNELLTLQAVSQADIPPPSSVMENYPPELERIVLKALDKDREKRYQTCNELKAELENFAVTNSLIATHEDLGRYIKMLFADEPDPLEETKKLLEEYKKQKYGESKGEVIKPQLTPEGEVHISDSSSLGRGGTFNPFTLLTYFINRRPVLAYSIFSVLLLVLALLFFVTMFKGGEVATDLLPKDKTKLYDLNIVKNYTIKISSIPENGLIYIDGKLYRELTPTMLKNLDITYPRTIMVEVPGGTPKSKVISMLLRLDELRFEFYNVKPPGLIQIKIPENIDPDDLIVKIDEREFKGLLKVPVVPEESHKLFVIKGEDVIIKKEVMLKSGEIVELNLLEEEKKYIKTKSTQEFSQVQLYLKTRPLVQIYLGSKLLGNGVVNGNSIAPGKYKLKLYNPNLNIEYETVLRIPSNTPIFRKVIDIPYGYLVVSVTPSSQVYLNGVYKDITPTKLRLYAGTHSIEVKYKGKSKQYKIKIEAPGEVKKIEFKW